MPNNLPSINLVKDKEIPLSGRFVDWALTIGRTIVIITEIIAIATFVYRFSLDERLANLHSLTKEKQTKISSMKNDENKYRNLQDRIALAATFSEKGIKASQSITNFGKLIPDQAEIDNLNFNKNQVNMVISVNSVSLLADLINSLKNYSDVKSISIDNIENKPTVGLSVSMTILLK